MNHPVQAPPDTTPLTAAMNAEHEVMREKAAAWDTHVAQGRATNDAMFELIDRLKTAVADLPAEPLDYRRCPRPECGSDATMERHRADPFAPRRIGIYPVIRHCTVCAKDYRVEFRAVRVEAE